MFIKTELPDKGDRDTFYKWLSVVFEGKARTMAIGYIIENIFEESADSGDWIKRIDLLKGLSSYYHMNFPPATLYNSVVPQLVTMGFLSMSVMPGTNGNMEIMVRPNGDFVRDVIGPLASTFKQLSYDQTWFSNFLDKYAKNPARGLPVA